MNIDTIAAITTAPGEAGISVVRVSGPDALKIADTVFRCSGNPPSERAANSFVHGFVKGEFHKDIDEAILLIYRTPHSYTGEDVIELQGHGGSISAKRILRTALNAGARMAEPGEFTRRAFLSGRIDLLQAEAVMDLIKSSSDRAASAALEQLEGSLSNSFTSIYDNIIDIAADLEATLDFGEDELPASTFETLKDKTKAVRSDLQQLLASWDEGHLLREGALVVISGRPNVGKSTLLNAMLGSERAIVTHVAGTTRDTLEEQIILGGIPIRLVDTAGLRDTTCDIEEEGIRRARHKIKHADINIFVIDGSGAICEEEKNHIEALDPHKSIIIINKTDLGSKLSPADFKGFTSLSCGVRDGIGLDEIKSEIIKKLGISSINTTPHATISERHRIIIKRVADEIDDIITMLASGNEELGAMAAASAREALEDLGEVTGRNYHAELLDNVFGKFCVGK